MILILWLESAKSSYHSSFIKRSYLQSNRLVQRKLINIIHILFFNFKYRVAYIFQNMFNIYFLLNRNIYVAIILFLTYLIFMGINSQSKFKVEKWESTQDDSLK